MKLLMNVACTIKASEEPIILQGVECGYNELFDMLDWYVKQDKNYYEVERVYLNLQDDVLLFADWELVLEIREEGLKGPYLYETIQQDRLCEIIERCKKEKYGYTEYDLLRLNLVL